MKMLILHSCSFENMNLNTQTMKPAKKYRSVTHLFTFKKGTIIYLFFMFLLMLNMQPCHTSGKTMFNYVCQVYFLTIKKSLYK